MNKPRPTRSLAELASGFLAETFKQQGFASTELVTRWPDIVGAEIAAHAEPIKLQWQRTRRRRAARARDAGAARRGPGGDRDPAPVRRHPRAGQPLLRLAGGRAASRLRQAPLNAPQAPARAADGRSGGGRARRRHADRRRRRRACAWRSAGSAPRSSELTGGRFRSTERDRGGLGEPARQCHIRGTLRPVAESDPHGASRDHTSGIRCRNQRACDRSPRSRSFGRPASAQARRARPPAELLEPPAARRPVARQGRRAGHHHRIRLDDLRPLRARSTTRPIRN